ANASWSSPWSATPMDVSFDTTVPLHPLRAKPVQAGFDNGAARLIPANKTADTLTAYLPFGGSGASTTTISLPVGSCPWFVQSRESLNAYVANNCAGTVSVISLTTLNLQKTVAVGSSPVGLAELASGTKIYVANQGSN